MLHNYNHRYLKYSPGTWTIDTFWRIFSSCKQYQGIKYKTWTNWWGWMCRSYLGIPAAELFHPFYITYLGCVLHLSNFLDIHENTLVQGWIPGRTLWAYLERWLRKQAMWAVQFTLTVCPVVGTIGTGYSIEWAFYFTVPSHNTFKNNLQVWYINSSVCHRFTVKRGA